MSVDDFGRGVEAAADIYREVFAEYVAENDKLRELARDMFNVYCVVHDEPLTFRQELDYDVEFWERMRALGVEVDE